MKCIFIVNPTSGGGLAKKVSEKIEIVCRERGIEYEMYHTRFPREATDIVRTYKHKKYIIFSVGGDGTLNEIVNGIVGTRNILGVVPAGSGNDFYRSLKLLPDLYPIIDVGKINDRYFINVASIGIDAEVGANAELMKKKKIPKSQIYNASILYTFLKYKFKKLSYKMDGIKKEGIYTLITICNGKYYGNGYYIGPGALLDDGMLDIYFADKMSKARILGLIGKLKKGEHESDSSVHKFQSDEIVIKSDREIICGLDGEVIMSNKFKFKIIKNALKLYNDKQLIDEFMDI